MRLFGKMNKMMRRSFLRGIFKTFDKFLLLSLIIMIGVAFFVGITSSYLMMDYSVQQYEEKSNLRDIVVYSSLGFEDTDITSLKEQLPDTIIEGAYFKDVYIDGQIFRLNSIQEKLNQVTLLEGRMPETSSEILMPANDLLIHTYHINEQVKIENTWFTVVGLIQTPVYLSHIKEISTLDNKRIEGYAYLLKSYFEQPYTEMNIKSDLPEQGIIDTLYTQSQVQKNRILNSLKEEVSSYQEKIDVLKAFHQDTAQLEEAVTLLQSHIDKVEDGSWTYLTKDKQYHKVLFENTLEQMKAISFVFPVFFLLVAVLVCLSVMARMIDEQRMEIGIFLGLGFQKRTILFKYLMYSIIASCTGGILGSVLGLLVFPIIIYQAWEMLFDFPVFQFYIPIKLILLTCTIFILTMCITVYSILKKALKPTIVTLMRPKVIAYQKSSWLEKIIQKTSLITRLTIRNIFKNTTRFLMTVLGIAGCCALLLVGFGIKDSIGQILTQQYDHINNYQAILTVTNANEDTLLKQEGVNEVYEAMIYDDAVVNSQDDEIIVHYIVLPSSSQSPFNTLKIPKKGIGISYKLAEKLDVEIGDTVTVYDADKKKSDVRVESIFLQYVYDYVVMSQETYESLFNIPLQINTMYVKGNINETALLNLNDVTQVDFDKDTIENFERMISGLNIITIVIIVSSGLLALVVLSNLTRINISERSYEIATLKVLGFYKKILFDTIFKENLFLTFVGCIVGIPLGIWLHHYIITLVENDNFMFYRSINFLSIIYSVILTLVFTVLCNQLMKSKINEIDMVESLKSVD